MEEVFHFKWLFNTKNELVQVVRNVYGENSAQRERTHFVCLISFSLKIRYH